MAFARLYVVASEEPGKTPRESELYDTICTPWPLAAIAWASESLAAIRPTEGHEVEDVEAGSDGQTPGGDNQVRAGKVARAQTLHDTINAHSSITPPPSHAPNFNIVVFTHVLYSSCPSFIPHLFVSSASVHIRSAAPRLRQLYYTLDARSPPSLSQHIPTPLHEPRLHEPRCPSTPPTGDTR